jgi:hypothetical protein
MAFTLVPAEILIHLFRLPQKPKSQDESTCRLDQRVAPVRYTSNCTGWNEKTEGRHTSKHRSQREPPSHDALEPNPASHRYGKQACGADEGNQKKTKKPSPDFIETPDGFL